jgi:hypothetical protein
MQFAWPGAVPAITSINAIPNMAEVPKLRTGILVLLDCPADEAACAIILHQR